MELVAAAFLAVFKASILAERALSMSSCTSRVAVLRRTAKEKGIEFFSVSIV